MQHNKRKLRTLARHLRKKVRFFSISIGNCFKDLWSLANRIRQCTRPKDPLDLDFDLHQDHIPDGFLKADIKKHGNRHIILATDQQLEHLSKAKSWYIDGTLKLVKRPFQQLFTINAFVRTDDHANQVPLVFVLMSGRKKKDYRKVTHNNQSISIVSYILTAK